VKKKARSGALKPSEPKVPSAPIQKLRNGKMLLEVKKVSSGLVEKFTARSLLSSLDTTPGDEALNAPPTPVASQNAEQQSSDSGAAATEMRPESESESESDLSQPDPEKGPEQKNEEEDDESAEEEEMREEQKEQEEEDQDPVNE
jgi:hypothetical protein